MAFTVTALGSVLASSAGGATLVYTTTADCPAGSTLVVLVWERVATVAGSMAASAGGTPTLVSSKTIPSSGGITQVFTRDHVTADLAIGGTLTYTRNGSGHNVSMVAFCVQGTDLNAPAAQTPTSGTGATSPTTTSISRSSLFTGQLVLGFASALGTVFWTNPMDYSPPFSAYSGTSLQAGLAGGYKVVASGTETYAPTFTHSGTVSWADLLLIYNPVVGVTMTAGTGTFTETGAGITTGYFVTHAGATYTLTGSGATFGTFDTMGSGTFTLTGEPATFTIAMPPLLIANAGMFTLTGEAVTFAEKMPAAVGVFTLTGEPVTFSTVTGASFNAGPGLFILTGGAIIFDAGFAELSSGIFALTGSDVAFFLHTVWTPVVHVTDIWTLVPIPSDIWTPIDPPTQ